MRPPTPPIDPVYNDEPADPLWLHYPASGRLTWCKRWWWSPGPKGYRLLKTAMKTKDVDCPDCLAELAATIILRVK